MIRLGHQRIEEREVGSSQERNEDRMFQRKLSGMDTLTQERPFYTFF